MLKELYDHVSFQLNYGMQKISIIKQRLYNEDPDKVVASQAIIDALTKLYDRMAIDMKEINDKEPGLLEAGFENDPEMSYYILEKELYEDLQTMCMNSDIDKTILSDMDKFTESSIGGTKDIVCDIYIKRFKTLIDIIKRCDYTKAFVLCDIIQLALGEDEVYGEGGEGQ